ncbi:MAG: phosphoribosylformylglycinamidine synthase I [Elusimicrobia bacterium]|nr:phosphoribosylformylglycinamidine synthase I [Elusimicrobiota bacterium]MBD3411840.1 phosphoribosylformylglycinamidine synthase I [Elusimicrobiota bacterium]
MKKKFKAIVLRTAGTNCDAETVHAAQHAGFTVDLVHINELFSKKKKLSAYVFLIIPGGFSYGDDIASGRVFANQLRFRLARDMLSFVNDGKLVLGICNGFQVLVKTGILPGFDYRHFRQDVSLIDNDSERFEDRWVYLKKISRNCVFTRDMPERIFLPVAHAEGKFVTPDSSMEQTLWKENMVVLTYTDSHGVSKGYPWNPNGSQGNIAGICNNTGRILGLMPHPERFVLPCQHPFWTRCSSNLAADGIHIFRNAFECVRAGL